jgi:hypothetical protein
MVEERKKEDDAPDCNVETDFQRFRLLSRIEKKNGYVGKRNRDKQ